MKQPVDLASGRLLFQFTVQQFHEMMDKGILSAKDRVELVNGLVVRKSSQNTPHASMVEDFYMQLAKQIVPGWKIRSQLPITLVSGEPEPDFAIIRGRRKSNDKCHPTVSECGIVMEVSDSTLRYDRNEKGPFYSAAGIPEYWIINLEEGVVEVYTHPTPDGYDQVQVFRPGECVPFILDAQLITTFSVTELFAPTDE